MWNLDDPQDATVFAPARKNPHGAEITAVAWNRKYQHILATASANGVVVVWDLKKKKTVTTFNTRHNVTALCWSPDGVCAFLCALVRSSLFLSITFLVGMTGNEARCGVW